LQHYFGKTFNLEKPLCYIFTNIMPMPYNVDNSHLKSIPARVSGVFTTAAVLKNPFLLRKYPMRFFCL
jgi:hypothetical protein